MSIEKIQTIEKHINTTASQKIVQHINNMIKKIIYTRKSIGKDGKKIKVYKLKTVSSKTGKILPMRKFLSRTGMDEIPQIINIIKGEMKLVGYRPNEKETYKKFLPQTKKELQKYKPGLLGAPYAFKKINPKNHKDVEIANRCYTRLCKKYGEIIVDIILTPKILYNKAFHHNQH